MRTFEDDSTVEFTFYLADRLRMTVADLEERMTNAEFVRWTIYHGRRAQDAQIASAR